MGLLLYVAVAATNRTSYNSPPRRKRSVLMGLIASVIGILKGAILGIAPQLAAFLGGLPGGTH